jgi:hypothetical protein
LGPKSVQERGLGEEGQNRKKFFSRWSSPFFQSPPHKKITPLPPFSPYIYYTNATPTQTHTRTHAARREKNKKKEKEKVRSLLFYPLGDGTIESKSRRREKEEVKKGGERERIA